MSITDELREWWVRKFPIMDKELHEDFTAIAGRIDATNETAMSRAGQLLADVEKDRDYNYANWQECKQKVLQHNITMDELSAEIERLKDELAHRIELPKDADGEYIHIGDEMDTEHFGTVEVEGFVHNSIAFYNYSGQPAYLCTSPVTLCRHHHAPTVEDVLTELTDEVWNRYCFGGTASDSGISELVAEYAAKLRLADDGEEG